MNVVFSDQTVVNFPFKVQEMAVSKIVLTNLLGKKLKISTKEIYLRNLAAMGVPCGAICFYWKSCRHRIRKISLPIESNFLAKPHILNNCQWWLVFWENPTIDPLSFWQPVNDVVRKMILRHWIPLNPEISSSREIPNLFYSEYINYKTAFSLLKTHFVLDKSKQLWFVIHHQSFIWTPALATVGSLEYFFPCKSITQFFFFLVVLRN